MKKAVWVVSFVALFLTLRPLVGAVFDAIFKNGDE